MAKISSYESYYSDCILKYLKEESRPVSGVENLLEVGEGGGLETADSLKFLCELFEKLSTQLNAILNQRAADRIWIDQRTKASVQLNSSLNIDFLDPCYQTVLGQEDASGRIVFGPLHSSYCQKEHGKEIAPLPEYLQGYHVTLFGPPDDPKLSINAMNCYHRKIKDEPPIVAELLATHESLPKWGADDEDSKTPLRKDLVAAGVHLSDCFEGKLSFADSKTGKLYSLNRDSLALPIKRIPGLALPCLFLLYKGDPLPLHLYDFALHLFKNWANPKALSFYIPKLETQDEARYVKEMIETAEILIKQKHPQYRLGTIRVFIVLENPRAIFRVHEIMDELFPYFAGASLGWHDYLSSTARIFKEDHNYRIPVKADPNIVIKYIKASHQLLSDVVGSRGGIKVGGMYGVLPIDNDLKSPTFQVTMKGFIKDVITQMKRNLSGFWVAHPDFVRIGLALVEGWRLYSQSKKLEALITSLLHEKYHQEILSFVRSPDLSDLDLDHPLYARTLIVADIKESDVIANNDPEEIRYNVFQALQYLTDWLSGNGCVALPAQIDGVSVRVMDDLATAERSRWEVWHEIHHGRFCLEEFLKIVAEEMTFIRKDLSNDRKIVQVKWDERTQKWYPIAMKIMIQLMTNKTPVEFATELLLPFTIESVRNSKDPWNEIQKIDFQKYKLPDYVERFVFYFSICGNLSFAKTMAKNISVDLNLGEKIVFDFEKIDIQNAAYFHGDIGENKKTLDEMASREQAKVLDDKNMVQLQLKALGEKYLKRFGFKFLISALNKSGIEILESLKTRIQNSETQELKNAKKALWEISLKRFGQRSSFEEKIENSRKQYKIEGAMLSVSTPQGIQTLCFGEEIHEMTWFELASLSKPLATCFAMEYFKKRNIPLTTSVNSLLEKTDSTFRISSLNSKNQKWGDEVTLEHLMSHSALNMHYVNGIPANQRMPRIDELIGGNAEFQYEKIGVINSPGEVFHYSGGGFLVLEHLLESLEKKSIQELTQPFFEALGLKNITFEQKTLPHQHYAHGYLSDGSEVDGTRKMFPAFAAGAMGTSQDFLSFMTHMTKAFHSRMKDLPFPISHDTAVRMLHGTDKSSVQFMGAKMGLGIFTAVAGPNRFAIHQGANDGFRCLVVHCYDGPDIGYGFVILCNGDSNGIDFIAEVAQVLFCQLNLKGLDLRLFKHRFDSTKLKQEEVVNQALKDLVFCAFEPDLPEKISNPGAIDSLSPYNLAVDGSILEVSNQGFARAENLLSEHLPNFDPELFGQQGKIMDSWETVRHNQALCDHLIFEIKKPSRIEFVSLSTQFHLGNQAPLVRIEGLGVDTPYGETCSWQTILPLVSLDGHAIKYLKAEPQKTVFKTVKVSIFPDGGLTRLGLFGDNLPQEEKEKFQSVEEAQSHSIPQSIPQVKKPLTPNYSATGIEIQKNWASLRPGSEVDIASSAFGGRVIHASNQHYGPAAQIISPFAPIHMFDGFESARSRDKNHFEEVIVELGKSACVHRIEVDFQFFKNNNPRELKIEGLLDGRWTQLVEKTYVKPYAGNFIEFPILNSKVIGQIKVTVFPDGGMNRVRAFSRI